MKVKEILKDTKKLSLLSPRICDKEIASKEYIIKRLESRGIEFYIQEFKVTHPKFIDWKLYDVASEVKCLPSGLKSGKLKKLDVINSLDFMDEDYEEDNINYNPFAIGISTPNIFNSRALSIDVKDKNKEFKEGYLKVKKFRFKSSNIMYGNFRNPKLIILSHYDSLWGGVIDNGFSVAILINLPKRFLKHVLVVLAGSEEVCYEKPNWSYGYIKFQEEFKELSGRRLIIMDTVGQTKLRVYRKKEIVNEAIVFVNEYKAVVFSSKFKDFLKIWHSPKDTMDMINNPKERIKEVIDKLDKFLKHL